MFQLPPRVLQFLPGRRRPVDPATDRDRRIARRLQDLFERDMALSEIGDLQFFVHRGSVVLKGDVPGEEEREIVLQLIGMVPEVRRVVDHLGQTARAA